MSVAADPSKAHAPRRAIWAPIWVAAIVGVLLLRHYSPEGGWLSVYPDAWIIPLDDWISAFIDWLTNSLTFGLFTFTDLTRGLSWLLDQPLQLAVSVLARGFQMSYDSSAPPVVAPVSWLALIVAMVMISYRVGGRRIAVLTFIGLAYIALFGQWASAMVTLASVIVSVPIGVAGGLILGVLADRSRSFRLVLMPILDLMQTIPVFAYLVPILVLFGFGPVAALIATIVYAMPPMVRITILALGRVPDEILEFGRMAGCTRRQMTWKVRVPSALGEIMVGVNQVIMLSLNMVIIASMIGAGGLGFDVLRALRTLHIGKGIEAGVAITLMAIVLDRLSQASVRGTDAARQRPGRRLSARAFWLTIIAVVVIGALLGEIFPAVAVYPEDWTVTTAPYWDQAMTYINIHFYNTLETIKAFLLINFMVPFKRFLISLPWLGVVALVGLAGLRLGGWRLALGVVLMAGFIAVTGNWEKAMVSTYLCGTSVIIATLIGVPVGIWSARVATVKRVVDPLIDTLQTLPSFVYLIPVVMLFQVGDFSAMIAIVAYAVVPAIRYTDHGIRNVPAALTEAATAAGCTRRQLLWKVQLPLAVPHILLGVNQTIMMALSMLVITALVGTSDLGQQVYIALTNADSGQGIVAGVCVAFLAIIADRLIAAGSARLKEGMGLEE